MNICPVCKGSFSKRKQGCCPGCGAEITVIGGFWVAEKGKVVDDFIKLWNQLQSKKMGTPVYISPRNPAYRMESKAAIRLIVEAGDVDTARAALVQYYDNPRFSWKGTDSLNYLFRGWATVVALVRKEKESHDKKAVAMQERVEAIPDLDIWGDIYGE